jgi:hypothetical protein
MYSNNPLPAPYGAKHIRGSERPVRWRLRGFSTNIHE